MTLTSFGMYVVQFPVECQLGVSLRCQQLWTKSILREPVLVVKGLQIKPYLLGDVGYVNWDYIWHKFKLVDGNLDKIMFDRQMNVGRITLK
jgi:hypothetical protein